MENLDHNPDGGMDSMVNLAAALALLDGDRELLGELVGIFLQESPSQLASVRDAIERHDAPALRRTAHFLKGSVSTFGSSHALEVAARMESRGLDRDMAGASADLGALERAVDGLRESLLLFR
jgi:HPt (histidine-containing phosphotransfer) domain-containing protein